MTPALSRYSLLLGLALACAAFAETGAPPPEPPQQLERYRAAEFLVLMELDRLPPHIIDWDRKRSETLYIENGIPKLVFAGTIKNGYHFYFNGKKAPTKDGRFSFKFRVPPETTAIPVKVFDSRGTSYEYRLLNHWVNTPQSLRYKVREEDRLTERQLGLSDVFKPSAFVQLYTEGTPTQIVDLDAQQHSKLTFRILTSVSDVYDGWILTIRNKKKQLIAKVGRFGSPPEFIDWQEVSAAITRADTYYYQVNLYYDGRIYEGKISQFKAKEGYGLVSHPYTPLVSIEPEGGFGFLFYDDPTGSPFSRVYMHFDLPITFFDRFFVRLGGFTTLHQDGSDDLFTFTRLGGGIRFFNSFSAPPLGDPFVFRLAVSLNYTGFTASAATRSYRAIHPAVLIEPHLLLFDRHFVQPWFEYGIATEGTQKRLSIGVMYNFYIRPWSVVWGAGVIWDSMLTNVSDPNREFRVFRTLMRFSFIM